MNVRLTFNMEKGKNIYLKNEVEFHRKVQLFQKAGSASSHVVADFDRTLTTAFVEGKKFLSSYALIREGKYLTTDYPAKAHALFDKYHPYEIDEALSTTEKNKWMNKWWSEHFELMKECGMNKAVIHDIVLQRKIQFREGALDFLNLLAKHRIPVLIFSAGLGDIIKELLESEGKLTSNVHLLSNFYLFDEQGIVIGKKNKNFIHTFNKSEVEVKKTPYYNEIKQRKNVLLLGDSLGDLGMTEGIEHDGIIRVGFLNENKEELLSKYMEAFDVVITDDGGMGYVNRMVGEIIG